MSLPDKIKKITFISYLNKLRHIFVENMKRPFCSHSKKFKELKNKYSGEKCFIVATGPSLKIEDLEAINGFYSFSVNSIINVYDKTDWRPNFYVMSDRIPYEKFIDKVKEKDYDYIFFPKDFRNSSVKHYEFQRNEKQFWKAKLKNKYRGVIYPSSGKSYFEDAPSVIFLTIQIAVYLGFKEIYLLGQDCNYNLLNQHSGIANPNYTHTINKDAGLVLIDVFDNYNDYYTSNGIRIINCTRGGMLEVFPRKEIEDIVKG